MNGFRGRLRCFFGGGLESEDKQQYVYSMVLGIEREKGERKMESLAVKAWDRERS